MARAQSVTIHRKSPTTPVTTEFPDVIKGNGTYNTVTLQYGLHVAVVKYVLCSAHLLMNETVSYRCLAVDEQLRRKQGWTFRISS